MIGDENYMINKDVILKESKKYDSFYLYDEKTILQHIDILKKDFDNVEFLYSIKANPNPKILDTIFSQGFGADAASLGEVILSKKHGLKKDQIYYSTPGKTLKDIEKAIDDSVIIADSINEVYKIFF